VKPRHDKDRVDPSLAFHELQRDRRGLAVVLHLTGPRSNEAFDRFRLPGRGKTDDPRGNGDRNENSDGAAHAGFCCGWRSSAITE
jgi:hypothetical protein